jgi:hypothetical protein
MKKLYLSLMACALCFTVAAQGNTNVSDSLFNGREFSVSLSTVTDFKTEYRHNLTVGTDYYLSRYVGVTALVPVYLEDGGNVLDNVSAGLTVRYPVARNLAVVGRGLANWNWETDNWGGAVGGALEFRLNKKWGLFAGADYTFPNVNKTFKDGSWVYNGGLRLAF